ncbi:MAG TPA: HAMP domain-containing sensor histidine kinase, partial [Acidimicrobiia bacterium]|nr:HAMP domain-containing sensor histidine kinase [Acidimicrobiia bacterium]
AAQRMTSRRRTVGIAVGAALVVLVLIAGLAFANSISVTNVTNNAKSLHWTNAALGTSALARAGLVQAVTFGELEENGLVADGDFAYAMEQLGWTTEELLHLQALGLSHDSAAAFSRLIAAVDEAVQDLEQGDYSAAKEHVSIDVETAYLELSDSLMVEQEEIQAAIDDNSADGQALNGWVVFVLTLAVPGTAVVAYFIVARRQVRDLREQNRLALEAERTISRAKDSFIAGLSHELRTPLTSIYGFAEVLSTGGVRGAEATEETARIIANEAAEMTRLVDDLLAASRLESTGVEIDIGTVPVQEVIESAVTPFERAGLTVVRQPTSAIAHADAARLRHVLVNLLSNASKHGGPAVGIEVSEGDGRVDIEVWDNGSGVADGKMERLFDRFIHDGQAPLLTGSIGLGLAVASRLTKLMGGELEYQRFGGKTYFVVSLQSAPPVEATADEPESAAAMIRALSA